MRAPPFSLEAHESQAPSPLPPREAAEGSGAAVQGPEWTGKAGVDFGSHIRSQLALTKSRVARAGLTAILSPGRPLGPGREGVCPCGLIVTSQETGAPVNQQRAFLEMCGGREMESSLARVCVCVCVCVCVYTCVHVCVEGACQGHQVSTSPGPRVQTITSEILTVAARGPSPRCVQKIVDITILVDDCCLFQVSSCL